VLQAPHVLALEFDNGLVDARVLAARHARAFQVARSIHEAIDLPGVRVGSKRLDSLGLPLAIRVSRGLPESAAEPIAQVVDVLPSGCPSSVCEGHSSSICSSADSSPTSRVKCCETPFNV
jgi:hypothetical protein